MPTLHPTPRGYTRLPKESIVQEGDAWFCRYTGAIIPAHLTIGKPVGSYSHLAVNICIRPKAKDERR